jgi:hypothetical protein
MWPKLAKLYVADGRASHVARKKSSGAIETIEAMHRCLRS